MYTRNCITYYDYARRVLFFSDVAILNTKIAIERLNTTICRYVCRIFEWIGFDRAQRPGADARSDGLNQKRP